MRVTSRPPSPCYALAIAEVFIMNEYDFDHDEQTDEQTDGREQPEPVEAAEREAKPAIEPFDPFFRKRTRDADYHWA